MGRKSRYEEIIIRISPLYPRTAEAVPQTTPTAESSSDNFFNRLFTWAKTPARDPNEIQTYDGYVYTNLDIQGLITDKEALEDYEEQMFGLKLAGCGQIVVHWEQYQDYLRTFLKGERAAYRRFWGFADKEDQQVKNLVNLSEQLFDVNNAALQSLLNGELEVTDRPLRIWLHCTQPELTDLPWELLSCRLRQKQKARFSFVRGLPPPPLPKVSVTNKLRLAFIYEPEKAPDALVKAIEASKSIIDVVEMTEPPRMALKRAVSEGFELIHLVTDAALSLGHDGLLYMRESTPDPEPTEPKSTMFNGFYRLALNNVDLFKHLVSDQRLVSWNDKLISKLDIETCSAEELSTYLRGSRVTLLSLSTPKTNDTQPGHFQGSLLPVVYSAFASVGSYPMLPNVIAPLGACDDETLETFWRSFYSHLVSPSPSTRGDHPSFSVEEATALGLLEAPTALMALFLRQRLGRDFTHQVTRISESDEDVGRANVRLQVERSLLEQLRAIDLNYKDVDSKISDSDWVQAESVKHMQLEQEINSLSELEDDD